MKISFIIILLLSGCATPLQNNSGQTESPVGMVVTANLYATQAGAEILRAGGSAVDAAIAIETVLGLVEPQSSGLGGGGFMVYFDNLTKQVSVYDGRETAPMSVTPDLFIDESGDPLTFMAAKTSGISTGVPGMVSMLQLAHDDFGRLPWRDNFEHAKILASNGFAISPRLHSYIERFANFIPNTIAEGPLDAYHYFYDSGGNAKPVGYNLKNPAYAKTLQLIADDPRAFYQGSIADEIVQQISHLPRAGGLTKDDLLTYTARRQQALCAPYRSMTLCGPPPPSSWLAVAMIMGLLDRATQFSAVGAQDSSNWQLFVEAQRLAYIDRDQYVADTESVDVPISGMLNPSYISERARQISPDKANQNIQPGDPWAYQPSIQIDVGIDATYEAAGTTHFVVVDLQGNVVSMTASVESVFGSTRMAGGMFLNNQLTDFSFRSHDPEGIKIANSVEPGKRPRSSMSPTIVLDQNGEFILATGSPGGNSIIAYTAKTLVGVLAWGLNPQAAIDLPNVIARGDTVHVEKQRAKDDLISDLKEFGYQVDDSGGENSGLSVVFKDANGNLIGGVDSRREGVIELVSPPK